MELLVVLYITNLLKALFIIIVIFYLIRIIGRYLFPFLVQKGVNSMQQKMNNQYRQQQPSRREGEVTIERNRSGRSTSRQQDGDYIDFEEVD
jgi:hypothetical protein